MLLSSPTIILSAPTHASSRWWARSLEQRTVERRKRRNRRRSSAPCKMWIVARRPVEILPCGLNDIGSSWCYAAPQRSVALPLLPLLPPFRVQMPRGAIMPDRIPLYYTFGNHMHWVDMEWLWGYDALPGSARDMLRLCEEAGVKGNMNFDGIGYEKLAAEAPENLIALRQAVVAGTIEVVGASYGQPYGLFHGGETNVRQRVYGVRAVLRLPGVRARSFWGEGFGFFSPLTQLLRGVGYEDAALVLQWTWHTPHIPLVHVP